MENNQNESVTSKVTRDKTIRSLALQTTKRSVIDGVLSMLKPDDAYAWVTHPAEGETPEHYHLVAKMAKPTKLGKFRAFAMSLDPHSNSDNAKSPDGALRYLLHLDNPEKARIDQASLVVKNWKGYEEVLSRKSRSSSSAAASDCEVFDALVSQLRGRAPRASDLRSLLAAGYPAAKVRGVISALASLRQWHAVEFADTREASKDAELVDGLRWDAEQLDFWATHERYDGDFLAGVEIV